MPVGWLAARCGIRGQDHGRGAWHCHVVLPSDGLANEAISDVPTLAHHTSELFRRPRHLHGRDRRLLRRQPAAIYGPRGCTGSSARVAGKIAASLPPCDSGGRIHDLEHPHEIAEVILAELREQQGVLVQDVVLTRACQCARGGARRLGGGAGGRQPARGHGRAGSRSKPAGRGPADLPHRDTWRTAAGAHCNGCSWE
jgi:hypothetical protein